MDEVPEELRGRVFEWAQGALALQVAYVGVSGGLLTALAEMGHAEPAELARAAGADPGYTARWCDAAYAFELVDDLGDGVFALTELGRAFRPDTPGTLMPMAVQAMVQGHLLERAGALLPGGEQPGEAVLGERPTLARWFGPMLEHAFGPLLERRVAEEIPALRRAADEGGLVVDVGCGNGWYLRRLAHAYPTLRGIGLDPMEEGVREAAERAEAEDLADRLEFRVGDVKRFAVEERVAVIALNRALHHVWPEEPNVVRSLRDRLRPGGALVVWEPRWPVDREELRDPRHRGMAVQNLAEHVQGNRLLSVEEIEHAFRDEGLEPELHLFAEGREAVVVGTRAPG